MKKFINQKLFLHATTLARIRGRFKGDSHPVTTASLFNQGG